MHNGPFAEYQRVAKSSCRVPKIPSGKINNAMDLEKKEH